MVRTALIVLAILALLPPVLSVVYRTEFLRPVSTLMIGDVLTLDWPRRDWIGIEDVSPVLIRSVVMSEDGQFCSHHGVDWGALNEVITDALEGERPRGASTITMQTVKNLFLWNSRSFIRKGLEVPLALWLDLVLSKQRIMEIYLNIAEWDTDLYGIEAASRSYFGVSAADLTARQAALLAVTLPNPQERNPAQPGPGLGKLAGVIEARARKFADHAACLF